MIFVCLCFSIQLGDAVILRAVVFGIAVMLSAGRLRRLCLCCLCCFCCNCRPRRPQYPLRPRRPRTRILPQ